MCVSLLYYLWSVVYMIYVDWLVWDVIVVCKQKTADAMRISDGSSDVCSSDLESYSGVRCLGGVDPHPWCRCDSAAGLRRPKGLALRSDICAPRERPGAQGTCRMDSRCVRQRIGGIVPGVRVHRLSQPLRGMGLAGDRGARPWAANCDTRQFFPARTGEGL